MGPSMQLLTYEQARDKLKAERQWSEAAQRLPIVVLETLLLSLPSLLLFSAIDPSGFLLRRILLTPPLLVWVVWALACFWASLSVDSLLKKLGGKKPRHLNVTSFALLGLVNCVSVVALLWLAAGPA